MNRARGEHQQRLGLGADALAAPREYQRAQLLGQWRAARLAREPHLQATLTERGFERSRERRFARALNAFEADKFPLCTHR